MLVFFIKGHKKRKRSRSACIPAERILWFLLRNVESLDMIFALLLRIGDDSGELTANHCPEFVLRIDITGKCIQAISAIFLFFVCDIRCGRRNQNALDFFSHSSFAR